MKFATESWAKEMDTICPLIVKAYHRQARVDRPNRNDPHAEPRLIYQRQDNGNVRTLPPLPSVPPVPPAPLPMLEAVPKSAMVPVISVYHAARPADAVDAQLSGAEFEETSGIGNPGLNDSG